MYRLDHVSKHYQQERAVDDVTLEIVRGETTVLIGPSGCGKSTLLRILIGLVEPDAGSVLFDGQRVAPANIDSLRHQVGYVIQQGGLFPHLTARQNISLMAEHLGWSAEQQAARIDELCQLAKFPGDALERFPGELSGGQNQRVSLMRALMLDPQVLLLDEPLGALDPMIRFDLQEDLKAIFQRLRKTVVMVTHDLAEAAFFAQRIVLMRSGGIVQQGSLPDLFDEPANDFVSQFVRAQRTHLDAIASSS